MHARRIAVESPRASVRTDIVRVTNNRRPDIFPDWQRLP
jgi:hypothetical protein